MEKIKIMTLAAAGALLFFVGCDVDDDIYETAHPEHGTVTVTANWSGMGAGITKPANYTVAYGNEKLSAAQDTYALPGLLSPGNYTLYLYNNVTEIPVSVSGTSTTVTVNKVTAPGGLSGTFVEPVPGWLFTGRLATAVEKDTDYSFTVPMKQQVRELTLMIEPTGGVTDKIESITASLSGVAGSLDIDNDTHGTPSSVALAFTKITSGNNAGKWSVTVRILGITGTEQKLTTTIAFTGGSPEPTWSEDNLTSGLAGFNSDKRTPLILGSTAVETPTGAGLTATITGWKKGTGGTGTAN